MMQIGQGNVVLWIFYAHGAPNSMMKRTSESLHLLPDPVVEFLLASFGQLDLHIVGKDDGRILISMIAGNMIQVDQE